MISMNIKSYRIKETVEISSYKKKINNGMQKFNEKLI